MRAEAVEMFRAWLDLQAFNAEDDAEHAIWGRVNRFFDALPCEPGAGVPSPNRRHPRGVGDPPTLGEEMKAARRECDELFEAALRGQGIPLRRTPNARIEAATSKLADAVCDLVQALIENAEPPT